MFLYSMNIICGCSTGSCGKFCILKTEKMGQIPRKLPHGFNRGAIFAETVPNVYSKRSTCKDSGADGRR